MDSSVLLSGIIKYERGQTTVNSKEEGRTQCTAITIKYTTKLNVFS